jgi:mono/diheme cytochrome c family protein
MAQESDMRNSRFWQAACVVLALCGQTSAQPDSVPFVAGFERFARHQEIDLLQSGRLLLTELNCTACHTPASKDLNPKLGPRLNGAGNRLGHRWMEKFLANPQREKPSTTMPDVLADLPEKERAAAAHSLAMFLYSQQESFPKIKANGARGVPHRFWELGDKVRGRQIYHQVGCVACHKADEDYETVETKPSPLDQLLEQLDESELKELGLGAAARRVDSVPHSKLTSKYSRQSLTFFLLDPHLTRTNGRMPNLKLGVIEAADIAAWLLRETPEDPVIKDEKAAINAELVSKGRRLFEKFSCANCHTVKESVAVRMPKPLAELNFESSRSCLSAPQEGLPHYELDESQTRALKAAVDDESNPGTNASAARANELDLQLLKLNCLACHERNGKGGIGRYRRPFFETVGHVDIGDEGRLPPPLTAAGRKLSTAWLTQVLKGSGDVRSHMRIRMPVFPADEVKSMPSLLARADGGIEQPQSEREVFGDTAKLADDGRLLLDTGCVQCHPVRGDALPGVVGIDLQGIARRVQPQWFHDFLLNPGKLKPRTRMPTFFPNGKSQNAAILKGDTDRQIAAMWAYLKNVDKLKLPPKIERARSQDYELTPKDRPIVLRTFMKEAGTHAIAVGFPEKVHFAFDAEQVRPAVAWRGRFLDAQGTWFVRFAPPADPLGQKQIGFPPGAPFALLKASADQNQDLAEPTFDANDVNYQFRGYSLDKFGVPTIRYRFHRFEIEDCISPAIGGGLTRLLTITDRTPEEPAELLLFRGHFGKSLKHDGPLSYTNDVGVSVTLKQDRGHAGELEAREDGTHWVVPLKIKRRKVIEVHYQW